MARDSKKVSFELTRGVRLMGKSYFPKAKGKTIISIDASMAKELQAASKGKIVDAKPNTEIEVPKIDDGLDAAFGPENDGESE